MDVDAPEIFDAEGRRNDQQLAGYEYRIGIKDVVMLDVERHPEFSGKLKIDHRGTIRLPLLRERLQVSGKTIKEMESDIAWVLRKYVKSEPDVLVTIEEVKSKRFLVLGDGVENSGMFEMGAEEVRLLDAMLLANVPQGKDADLRKVRIIRPSPVNPTYVLIDAERVLMGRTRDNIRIQPGDILYIPKKFSKKVDEVVDEILKRSSQVIFLDSDFQYLEDLVPHRSTNGLQSTIRRTR